MTIDQLKIGGRYRFVVMPSDWGLLPDTILQIFNIRDRNLIPTSSSTYLEELVPVYVELRMCEWYDGNLKRLNLSDFLLLAEPVEEES